MCVVAQLFASADELEGFEDVVWLVVAVWRLGVVPHLRTEYQSDEDLVIICQACPTDNPATLDLIPLDARGRQPNKVLVRIRLIIRGRYFEIAG